MVARFTGEMELNPGECVVLEARERVSLAEFGVGAARFIDIAGETLVLYDPGQRAVFQIDLRGEAPPRRIGIGEGADIKDMEVDDEDGRVFLLDQWTVYAVDGNVKEKHYDGLFFDMAVEGGHVYAVQGLSTQRGFEACIKVFDYALEEVDSIALDESVGIAPLTAPYLRVQALDGVPVLLDTLANQMHARGGDGCFSCGLVVEAEALAARREHNVSGLLALAEGSATSFIEYPTQERFKRSGSLLYALTPNLHGPPYVMILENGRAVFLRAENLDGDFCLRRADDSYALYCCSTAGGKPELVVYREVGK